MSLTLLDTARLIGTIGTGLGAGALLSFGSMTTAGLLHERSDPLSPLAKIQALAGLFPTGGQTITTVFAVTTLGLGLGLYALPQQPIRIGGFATSRQLLSTALAAQFFQFVYTRFYMYEYGNKQIKEIAAQGRPISDAEATQRLQRFYWQHQIRTVVGVLGFVAAAVELLRP